MFRKANENGQQPGGFGGRSQNFGIFGGLSTNGSSSNSKIGNKGSATSGFGNFGTGIFGGGSKNAGQFLGFGQTPFFGERSLSKEQSTSKTQFLSSRMSEKAYRDWAIHQKKSSRIVIKDHIPRNYTLKHLFKKNICKKTSELEFDVISLKKERVITF